MEFKNILIIQTAFIGDAILASSLAEKLQASLPKASVSILVRKGNESIYEGHPFLKETLIWNKKENKIRNLFRLIRKIRKNKYDCVINCHRFASSGFITVLSGARHTAGYKQNPFSFLFNYTVKHRIGDGTHEIERYNELVQDFTDDHVFHPRLYPAAGDRQFIKKYQSGAYICIAPASVWFTKQLPVEKWIDLCNSIPEHIKIYLLGAPGDAVVCREIEDRTTRNNIQILAGELTLLQSCALMEQAEMNYVNDSAPMHLASSVNAPVTAFFCSTVPEFGFGPLSDRSTVLQVSDLPCKPCGLHGYRVCPLGHFKCGHEMPLPQKA